MLASLKSSFEYVKMFCWPSRAFPFHHRRRALSQEAFCLLATRCIFCRSCYIADAPGVSRETFFEQTALIVSKRNKVSRDSSSRQRQANTFDPSYHDLTPFPLTGTSCASSLVKLKHFLMIVIKKHAIEEANVHQHSPIATLGLQLFISSYSLLSNYASVRRHSYLVLLVEMANLKSADLLEMFHLRPRVYDKYCTK